MNDPDGDLHKRRHSLADWLALHELDSARCRSIWGAVTHETASEAVDHAGMNLGNQALGLEVAWQRTAEAMRDFFSDRHDIIDDSFEKTAKIVVNRPCKSRKALTLDNGPTAYPTILFSYYGEPSDRLIMAHEFAHALQIGASGVKFVPPVMREVCAFIGESALLSQARRTNEAEYRSLIAVWREDNKRYLGAQRSRLEAALLQPDTPYNYSWNYPIARSLASQIFERCSREWTWSIFAGEVTVPAVLRELAISPT